MGPARRIAGLAAILALALAGQAQAVVPVQTITVVNETHVRASVIRATERSLVLQSRQLRRYWGTPLVAFGRNGWRMVLQPGDAPASCACGGFHSTLPDGTPYARIWRSAYAWGIL